MNIITIDGTSLSSAVDLRKSILFAIGAPGGNGMSVDAMLDAIIWDDLSTVKPPYIIDIVNLDAAQDTVIKDISLLQAHISGARDECLARTGKDMDVRLTYGVSPHGSISLPTD